jgi:hypothetical protein
MPDKQISFAGIQPSTPRITIREHDGAYLINFDYNKKVVELFKRHILPAHRAFRKELNNGWVIHPDSIEIACQQLEAVYGGHITRPKPIESPAKPEIKTEIFRVEYVGSCYQRYHNPQESPFPYYSAYGALSPKVWGVEFPEEVLKRFFNQNQDQTKQEHQTLYQILLIQERADQQALKSAYRRLARQWHPDVCKEPDAAERFRLIDEAYKILIDPIRRNKYDAGLYFERQNEPADIHPLKDQWGYRCPLTSGLITVRGIQSLFMTRFLVQEILSWEDLQNNKGQVAVSSWRSGEKNYQIVWR